MNSSSGAPVVRRIMGVRLLDQVEGAQYLPDRERREDGARRRAEELLVAWRAQGVSHVLDVSPIGYGRDLRLLGEAAAASGVAVSCVTGLGPAGETPPALARLGALELAELFVEELTDGHRGVVHTLLFAGGPAPGAVVDAVAMAHAATGAPVVVAGAAEAIDAVRLLVGRGVEPQDVLVVGLEASTTPPATIEALGGLGVGVALVGARVVTLVSGLLVALDRLGPERTFVGEVGIDVDVIGEALATRGVDPSAIARLFGAAPSPFDILGGRHG